jgi:hypothetical protein
VSVPLADDLPQRLRKFLFDRFLERAETPVVEEVMTTFSLSREQATEALRGLEAARHIALVKETARILMAFPFSAVATAFRVRAGGRRYFANCAWDAIAFHAMLGKKIRVDSFCHHCGTPIRVEMLQGRAAHVEPESSLVYLAIPAAQWWDDIITTCSNTMVFFASPEHRDASSLCASADAGASLTPDQVHTLSGPLYSGRMELGYTRPSRQALLDHFAAMGLTGEFWKL